MRETWKAQPYFTSHCHFFCLHLDWNPVESESPLHSPPIFVIVVPLTLFIWCLLKYVFRQFSHVVLCEKNDTFRPTSFYSITRNLTNILNILIEEILTFQNWINFEICKTIETREGNTEWCYTIRIINIPLVKVLSSTEIVVILPI